MTILVMTDEGMAISSIRQRTRGRSVCVRLSEHSRLGDRTTTCTPPARDQSNILTMMQSCAFPPALSCQHQSFFMPVMVSHTDGQPACSEPAC